MNFTRSSQRRCSVKKMFLEISQFTREHLCQSPIFNEVAGVACNFIKKETLPPVFFYEFCKIFKNTFFIEHIWDDCFCQPDEYVIRWLFLLNKEIQTPSSRLSANSKTCSQTVILSPKQYPPYLPSWPAAVVSKCPLKPPHAKKTQLSFLQI